MCSLPSGYKRRYSAKMKCTLGGEKPKYEISLPSSFFRFITPIIISTNMLAKITPLRATQNAMIPMTSQRFISMLFACLKTSRSPDPQMPKTYRVEVFLVLLVLLWLKIGKGVEGGLQDWIKIPILIVE